MPIVIKKRWILRCNGSSRAARWPTFGKPDFFALSLFVRCSSHLSDGLLEQITLLPFATKEGLTSTLSNPRADITFWHDSRYIPTERTVRKKPPWISRRKCWTVTYFLRGSLEKVHNLVTQLWDKSLASNHEEYSSGLSLIVKINLPFIIREPL